MSRTDTLKSLEIILESFLDRAVGHKEERLKVLGGLNRLDDIARKCHIEPGTVGEATDRIGGWFAEHRDWLHDQTLRPVDRKRLGDILNQIFKVIQPEANDAPAKRKITGEIGRWQSSLNQTPPIPTRRTEPPVIPTEMPAILAGMGQETEIKPAKGRRIILRRGPESLEEAGVHPSGQESIGLFGESLETITAMFKDVAGDGRHLMSVLDDTLKSATLQNSREALLLSALIIYYLKRNGYMVQPFVKRLKEAEQLQKGGVKNASSF